MTAFVLQGHTCTFSRGTEVFIKNILLCDLKMNKSLIGLGDEGE